MEIRTGTTSEQPLHPEESSRHSCAEGQVCRTLVTPSRSIEIQSGVRIHGKGQPQQREGGRLSSVTAVWAVAGFILVLNLPFGFWRAGVRRFSPSWFLAVHVPVPLALGARFAVGVGWRVGLLPLFVGAYFAGQLLGGKVRRAHGR